MLILITGASSGIGRACAEAFAAEGHRLILTARRMERLESLRQNLRERCGTESHVFNLDIRDRNQIDECVRQHPELFNQVEVLINNAGLAKGLVPIQESHPEDWDTVIDTNVKGLLSMTRAVLPGMISRGKGHIINIGSVAGHWVYEKGAVYCASKFAVRALTEGLRLDLNGSGVRVTEVSPGMVETEFSEVRYGDKERAKAVYQGKKPLKAEDIAETVLWCVNRPSHVNIQEIVIYPTEQAGVHARAR